MSLLLINNNYYFMDTQPTGNTNAPQQNPQPAPVDAHNNVLMGILSYLGPLVFIPFALSKNDSFVKFHVKQGLVVFVIEAGLWVIQMIFPMLFVITQLLNLGALILSILGIINVVQKKEAQLPVVGSYSKYFTF